MYQCVIRGCASAHTHLTRGHVCERCGVRGHGVMECGDEVAMRRLRATTRHHHLRVSNRCTVSGCRHPTDHMSDWHHRPPSYHHHHHHLSQTRLVQQTKSSCPMCRTQVAYHHTIYIAEGTPCVVCMQYPINILFWPCKHACICDVCHSKIQQYRQRQ